MLESSDPDDSYVVFFVLNAGEDIRGFGIR